MIRLYIALFILSTVGAVAYGGYAYYKDTQERIATLRENNVKLELATETLQNTVTRMEEDAAKAEELNRNLTKRLQKSQVHLDALRNRLSEIDLTMEAIQDPEGLEERVNNAVEKLIGRIETETSPAVDPYDDADSVRSDGTESNDSD